MCELKTYGWKNAFFLLALFYLGTLAEASASEVTFEYAPPEWQTAICLPDDPHKSLVDHKGKLLYHYNKQGLEFGTTVCVEAVKKAAQTDQQLLSPRIPIVQTTRETNSLTIVEEAFAITTKGNIVPEPSRNDVILVTVTNNGEKTEKIQPKLIIDSGFRLKKMGAQGVQINRHETVRCTQTIANIAILKREHYRAEITLKPLEIRAGESVQFALIYHGGETIYNTPLSLKQVLKAREKAEDYWQEAELPYGSVTIPDPGIQALIDSSIRNIWQAREIKDGLPAYQVGPTCYRGLWIVDGAFLLEAAALVGAGDDARAGVQYMLSKQSPSGAFEVLAKDYYKENGIVLWTCVRHAMLTQDKKWLSSVWPQLEKAVAYIKILREKSKEDPEWLCHGLMPPGEIDGGLSELTKGEYTNVYWNLLGLKAAIHAADWLGRDTQAMEWKKEYLDFYNTFRKRAEKDLRKDPHGNTYLPTIMNNIGEELPQRAQWAFCHGVYPGQLFDKEDPLVSGNLAMLAATEREGMVYGTGWDEAGFWTYFASFYGHAWLWQGNGKKAYDSLYAMANHASPLLTWREEQNPKGEPYNKVGDMPHNWASAEFIRLAIHLLALDRGNELHLFEGMPAAWAKPGMKTALNGVATPFGPLSFELVISSDGNEATLTTKPLSDSSCCAIVVHQKGWTTMKDKLIQLDPAQGHKLTIPLK